MYNQIDFEKLLRYKTAEISIHCQPFKYALSEMEKIFTFSSVSSGSLSIRNNGNYFARPELKIRGSGNIDISLNGGKILELDLETDQTIIIDSFDMNAYALNGDLLNRKVKGDYDEIKLLCGKNEIAFEGDVSLISVNKYSRWI